MRTKMAWGLVVALALVGCGKEERNEPDTPVVIHVSPELEARLAVADLADGTEDQVVSRCLGCGLAMEGSAEHVAHVGDYSMNFCSVRCKDNFADDPEDMLMALAVEGEPEAE